MRKLLSAIFVLVMPLLAMPQVYTAYLCAFGGPQDDNFNQIMMTKDSGYIAIGTTSSFGAGNTDFYVVKTDRSCRHQWSKTYGGPLNEEGFSVAQTYDSGYVFLGFTDSYGYGSYDVFLVKTDSVGNVKWQKTYGGTDWDFGYSVKETPADSGFIICGLTYSYGMGNGDAYVIKTDKNGDTLWTRIIGGTGYDVLNCAEVHSNTLYGLLGSTTSFGKGDTDMYFLEFDNKGNVKKDTTFGSIHNEAGYSIRNTTSGGYTLFGSSDSLLAGNKKEYFLLIDTEAHVSWQQEFYGGSGLNIGKDVVEDPVNTTYITVGSTNSFGAGGFDFYALQLNIGGYFITGSTFGGSKQDYGCSVTLGAGKTVAFGGSTNSFGQGLFDGMIVYEKLRRDTLPAYDSIMRSYRDTLSPAGIAGQTVLQAGVKIFPNPMVDASTILVQSSFVNGNYRMNLYDMTGRCVSTVTLSPTTHNQIIGRIEKGDMPSGMYFYEILNEEKKIATGKLVVQ